MKVSLLEGTSSVLEQVLPCSLLTKGPWALMPPGSVGEWNVAGEHGLPKLLTLQLRDQLCCLVFWG